MGGPLLLCGNLHLSPSSGQQSPTWALTTPQQLQCTWLISLSLSVVLAAWAPTSQGLPLRPAAACSRKGRAALCSYQGLPALPRSSVHPPVPRGLYHLQGWGPALPRAAEGSLQLSPSPRHCSVHCGASTACRDGDPCYLMQPRGPFSSLQTLCAALCTDTTASLAVGLGCTCLLPPA